MNRQELLEEILKLEWPMFSGVHNVGGKASCQLNPETFRIMRLSQYQAWGDELLASVLADLREAASQNRNLMAEKYARMMESTFPEEYARIASQIPPVPEETQKMVDEIVAAHIRWKEELDKKYPNLASHGRPLRSVDDIKHSTPSIETYMKSELRCLSPKTVALYHAETMRRVAENRSEAEENLLNQVRQRGFPDLESANRQLGARGSEGDVCNGK